MTRAAPGDVSLAQGGDLHYNGSGPDIGAYEFAPLLTLTGSPADQTIYLTWTVSGSLPITATRQIDYSGATGRAYLSITNLPTDIFVYLPIVLKGP